MTFTDHGGEAQVSAVIETPAGPIAIDRAVADDPISGEGPYTCGGGVLEATRASDGLTAIWDYLGPVGGD